MIAGVTRISEYEWEVPIGYTSADAGAGKVFPLGLPRHDT